MPRVHEAVFDPETGEMIGRVSGGTPGRIRFKGMKSVKMSKKPKPGEFRLADKKVKKAAPREDVVDMSFRRMR